jgi:RNA polymerase primary sigma factor
MSIKNFDQIKTLIDIGMEKGYLTPDEINDFLPQNIFSPEDIEDIFDFLSESNIDVVDTIKEKIETAEEEQREWEEAERFPTEKTDNIIWAYLKDIGRISLLSSEEEYDIAKRIEEGEARIRSLLFDMPLAIVELQELAAQIKKDMVNIIDIVKNIDEMNYTKKDEEQYKKRTITLANSLKNLREKKEDLRKQVAETDEFMHKQAEKKLQATENKIEEDHETGRKTGQIPRRARSSGRSRKASRDGPCRTGTEGREEPPYQGKPATRYQYCQEIS